MSCRYASQRAPRARTTRARTGGGETYRAVIRRVQREDDARGHDAQQRERAERCDRDGGEEPGDADSVRPASRRHMRDQHDEQKDDEDVARIGLDPI